MTMRILHLLKNAVLFVIWPLMCSLVNLRASGIFLKCKPAAGSSRVSTAPQTSTPEWAVQQPSKRPANVSRLSAQTRLEADSEMANGTGQFGISLQLQQHHAPMKSNYTLSSKDYLGITSGPYRRRMTDFSANKETTYFKSRRMQTYCIWIFLWE